MQSLSCARISNLLVIFFPNNSIFGAHFPFWWPKKHPVFIFWKQLSNRPNCTYFLFVNFFHQKTTHDLENQFVRTAAHLRSCFADWRNQKLPLTLVQEIKTKHHPGLTCKRDCPMLITEERGGSKVHYRLSDRRGDAFVERRTTGGWRPVGCVPEKIIYNRILEDPRPAWMTKANKHEARPQHTKTPRANRMCASCRVGSRAVRRLEANLRSQTLWRSWREQTAFKQLKLSVSKWKSHSDQCFTGSGTGTP